MVGGGAAARAGEHAAEGLVAKAAASTLRRAETDVVEDAAKAGTRRAESAAVKGGENFGVHGAENAAEHATQADLDRATIKALSDAGDIDGARRILDPFVDAKDAKGIIDRLDVSSARDKGFLWSGWKEGAAREAASRGGVTLETTSGGRVIDGWAKLAEKFPWNEGGRELWGGVSEKYAGQLTGDVRSFQSQAKFPLGGDTFLNYELPQVEHGLDTGRITSHQIELLSIPELTA